MQKKSYRLKKRAKFIILALLVIVVSCNNMDKRNNIRNIVNDWQGKEIVFPQQLTFTRYVKDTVEYSTENQLKILIYTDSIGCTSCRMKLMEWKKLIKEIDSIASNKISFVFVIHPKSYEDIFSVLRSNAFDFPVCIDENDAVNRKNKFPSNVDYQTFLLDKNNKVLLIGNPIYNSAIKQLYIKLIKEKTHIKNSTSISRTSQSSHSTYT